MYKKLMIDPPSGWKYGWPKYVDEIEGRRVLDLSLDELIDYVLDRGYPAQLKDQIGWTRFLWVDRDSKD